MGQRLEEGLFRGLPDRAIFLVDLGRAKARDRRTNASPK